MWSLSDVEPEALDAKTTALVAAAAARRVAVHTEMLSRGLMTATGAT